MEYRTILYLLTFQFYIIDCQSAKSNNNEQGEEEKLRSMMNTVLRQNKRLATQNKRIHQAWLGFQQMCETLSMSTCDCGNGQVYNQTTDPSTPPPKSGTSFLKTEHVLPLQVMSVRTGGAATDPTTISVTYGATLNHTTEWLGQYKGAGMLRTAGMREQDINDSSIYTSTVDVLQLGDMYSLYFRLYNDDESVDLRLNVTELGTRQEKLIKAPASGFLTIDKSFVAPRVNDLKITGTVNESLYKLTSGPFIDVFFIGINASASPPSVFEILRFDYKHPYIRLVTSGGKYYPKSSIDITIKYPYAQYGGILFVRMLYRDSIKSLVERLYYGPHVKVFPHEGMNVIRENAIGIYTLPRQTLVYQPSQSITCTAMGNPRPDVSVWKVTKDGKKKEEVTETVILDNYINRKVVTLSPDRPNETEGRYICRATNGNKTVGATTEAIVYEPIVIDYVKTGVIKNTSRSIVISCKARGKPKPHLELRLYNDSGPDLIKTGLYKVKRWGEKKYTTWVTLTISPVDDPDIHTVDCRLTQEGRPYNVYLYGISVYPGVKKENNIELYSRLQDAVAEADMGDF